MLTPTDGGVMESYNTLAALSGSYSTEVKIYNLNCVEYGEFR